MPLLRNVLQCRYRNEKKTKTADGTKNARRSVGQNAWFASGNFRVKGGLFLFKMVEPVCHVTEKEGDKFPHVALLCVQRVILAEHL